MSRWLVAVVVCTTLLTTANVSADVVQDWNATLNSALLATPTKHNPGIPSRAMSMTNLAIYDVFQAINRTHAPFKVDLNSPGASLDAAVAQAAYRTIVNCYGEQTAMLDNVLAARLAAIPNGPAKTVGISLGNQVAQAYIDAHANDGHDVVGSYSETPLPGHWSSDPLHSPQTPFGKAWGNVTPWAMHNSDQFDSVISLPALDSQKYVDGFNQVKAYGALNSAVRTADQTKIGLFWAYDRPFIGPPPVLFIENLTDIGNAIGNTPEQNARLFALATTAMADAVIAGWDVKYENDFWRPITAIRAEGVMNDGNANTIEDPKWVPLGAPGSDPNSSTDDFTPPFPSYVSGHSTMGGAVYKALELFYGTNDFAAADAQFGVDAVTSQFTLTSNEPGAGGARQFVRFTQNGPLTVGTENSPEGENAISRVYLGIHWLFDCTDGIAVGNAAAQYAFANHFQAVPEPGTFVLALFGAVTMVAPVRRGPCR